MKYYAITVNPLNVTRPKEDLDKAYEYWLKTTGCEEYKKVYELAGKKLHIHATVKRKSKPYLRRAKVYGYQIYFGGETTPKWYDYMKKHKFLEEESIVTHYCQNNYVFTK